MVFRDVVHIGDWDPIRQHELLAAVHAGRLLRIYGERLVRKLSGSLLGEIRNADEEKATKLRQTEKSGRNLGNCDASNLSTEKIAGKKKMFRDY